MEGVDKERVQRIVYEMSKGSQYFKNEERKEAFIREKIKNMRARCAKLKPADLDHFQTVRFSVSNSILCYFFFFGISVRFIGMVVVWWFLRC